MTAMGAIWTLMVVVVVVKADASEGTEWERGNECRGGEEGARKGPSEGDGMGL